MPAVFVYGTLKRGGENAGSLAGQRYLGEARTLPEYRLYGLDGYPGMVAASEGGLSIAGEIWEVDAACLARLDELEGVAVGLYARRPIALLPPYQELAVQTYVYLRSVAGRTELDSW